MLTVTPVNDAPVISPVTDQIIFTHTNLGVITFTIGDVESAAGALMVSGTSSNAALVPDANLVFGGADSNRTVMITPTTNQTGVTLITLFVSDGEGTNSTSFLLTVVPLADIGVSGAAQFDGTNLVVTVTLTNLGPDAASAVNVTNVLPLGASVMAVDSGAANCMETNGSVLCSFTSLAANTSAVVTLTLAIAPPDYFTNVISVGASEMDPDVSNNVATVIIGVAGPDDFDGDGMPDAWEMAHGLNPRVADGSKDPDGDGLTNLQEYLAGTDPHDPGSVLRFTSISLESGTNTVALSFLAASNLSYSILGTTNPLAGPWEKILDVPAAASGVVTITNLPGADTMRFYRVVTPPLPWRTAAL